MLHPSRLVPMPPHPYIYGMQGIPINEVGNIEPYIRGLQARPLPHIKGDIPHIFSLPFSGHHLSFPLYHGYIPLIKK
jgi:hypothetical protein